MRKLWYNTTAKNWNDALPVGNGRLGAMFFGNPIYDRLQINEETLWSGSPVTEKALYDKPFMDSVRSLVKERKYGEAHDAIQALFKGTESASYVTYGNLNIDILADFKEIKNYYRELNLENAVASASFSLDDNEVEKSAFISLADDVLVYRIKSSSPVSVRLTSGCELQHSLSLENGVMKTLGRCPTFVSNYNKQVVYDEDKESIPFCSLLKPVAISGDIQVFGGSTLRVIGSDFMLLFSLKTGFNGYDKQPISQGKEYEKACLETLEKASEFSYQELLSRHEKEYKKYFDRVSFTLEGEDYDEPTDERIIKAGNGRVDNKLVTLLFDFSRFLTICSNGIGTQATNLQGIWNEEICPLWRCNYTVNINTQMNYWAVNACDLPEMQLPLFSLLRDLKNQGNCFGLNGWALFHNTDIWRNVNVQGRVAQCGFWVTGAAWFCRHIWEQYAHTRDINFLKENYDIMVSCADFLLDFMIETDGVLTVCPSTAPENAFLFNGKKCAVTDGIAMDQAICIDFFDKLVKASEILNKDSSAYREILKKLPLPKTGSDGRVMEWNEEFEENETGHRHISHLYGFYPADIMGEEYADAIRKSIEVRIANAKDDFSCGQIGWSCAWLAVIYARLGDSEEFIKQLRAFFKTSIYGNMFSICTIFQIEANFGIAAAIIEALVQSHNGEIKLLPALPKEWTHGEVKGLVVRTGEKIDFKW